MRALDDCLRAMAIGASREQCLRGYPGLRDELAPLLDTVQAMRADTASFPAWLKASIRVELMESVMTAPRLSPSPRFGLRGWRLALAPAMAAAFLLIGLLFGLGASQAPDDAQAATVLTVIHGDVRIETAAGLLDGRNGAVLRPGDRVITQPGAQAVLTFFDGSTVTLDGDTVVEIRSVAVVAGQLHAVLAQTQGSTWTHIPEPLGPAQVEIDTPSARVQTQAASFETTVKTDGGTEIGNQAGSVAVQSGGQRSDVPGGHRASVETAGAAASTSASSQPRRELLVKVSGRAFAYLTDSRGATVGLLPPGVPVSQVSGATVLQEGGDLYIRLADPGDGAYSLRLSAAAQAAGPVTVSVGLVSSSPRTVTLLPGEDVALDITLNGDSVALLNLRREQAAKPELVVVPPAAIEKVNAVTGVASSTPAAAKPAETPSATPSPRPTQTPTPSPVPTRTATPAPKLTPSLEPLVPEDLSPSNLLPSGSSLR
jgi:hypothetical protein